MTSYHHSLVLNSHQQNFNNFLVTFQGILTSTKGRKSAANLRKNKDLQYQRHVDLVNDNVFTEFGLILSIRSQDIEQKPNSDINQGL